MSLRINLNTAAIGAHRTLTGTDNNLGKSIERLSSGFRINGAGDDPAGLVISEKLRAQVGGLGQAVKNAGDAVNMVKTAEGALTEVHRLLRSMRDLAVHASNVGANDAATATADQQQINNAIASINKIAAETQFGNKKLLDGTAGISTTITGTRVVTANFSSASNAVTGAVSYNITTAAAQATMYGQTYGTGHVAGSDFNAGAAASFTINGYDVTVGAGSTMEQAVTAINAKTAQTGVTASWNLATLQVKLTQSNYGSDKKIELTGASEILGTGTTSATAVGIDVVGQVSQSAGAVTLGDASWASGKGLTMKDSNGNYVTFTAAAGAATGAQTAELTLAANSLTFQVGAYAAQTRTVAISSVAASALGETAALNTIDVTSFSGAQTAIAVIDEAIAQVSNQRSTLGATQKNVLESSINSLSVAKENIAASESTIRDTDMAAEMVEFTKMQILQQAGTAMLAQANSSTQGLLSLLRG